MDLINDSDLPTLLVRSALAPDDSLPMVAAVVLKVSYQVDADGSLGLAPEQAPVREEDEETSVGTLRADNAPRKTRFDVAVYGSAYAPSNPVTESRVALSLGEERRELAVIGDRVWEGRREPRISEPQRFEVIPLGWERAYGGYAPLLGHDTPFGYNPSGRGFLLDEQEAEGTPLPNVERPGERIARWQDQPRPAGFAEILLASLFTVDRGIEHDAETGRQRVLPEVFQTASPDLLWPQAPPPGTPVRLEGMLPGAETLEFEFPSLRVGVAVRLGDKTHEPRGVPDTLRIFPEDRRIEIVHRTSFKYRFVPEQLREARVNLLEMGASR